MIPLDTEPLNPGRAITTLYTGRSEPSQPTQRKPLLDNLAKGDEDSSRDETATKSLYKLLTLII